MAEGLQQGLGADALCLKESVLFLASLISLEGINANCQLSEIVATGSLSVSVCCSRLPLLAARGPIAGGLLPVFLPGLLDVESKAHRRTRQENHLTLYTLYVVILAAGQAHNSLCFGSFLFFFCSLYRAGYSDGVRNQKPSRSATQRMLRPTFRPTSS